MIQVFGPDRTIIGLFKDYDGLFNHINTTESSKLLESNSSFSQDVWTFVLFTNKRLSYIFHKTLERSFSKVGKEAFEQELDLIEISKGDYHNPIQIPVTADVNVSELREKWCQEYCDTHDYVIVDHQNNKDHIDLKEIPAANIINTMSNRSELQNKVQVAG
ncbi:MAG: hypothetical protein K2Y18_06950 [Alphaproteobacteria bacterium]|jgi:hypothetical protein|nr:hypothetical protein [Alphaproteobacteria bacterium]